MNIRVRTRLTNSKISWIDIQFVSSKFTAVIRGSSPGCRVDKDTLVCSVQHKETGKQEGKGNISEYKKLIANRKREQGKVRTSSSSRHCVEPFGYDLLSLKVLLVRVDQRLFRFLRLSNCCLMQFLSICFGSCRGIKRFLRSTKLSL
jgi:hypothetical protein